MNDPMFDTPVLLRQHVGDIVTVDMFEGITGTSALDVFARLGAGRMLDRPDRPFNVLHNLIDSHTDGRR